MKDIILAFIPPLAASLLTYALSKRKAIKQPRKISSTEYPRMIRFFLWYRKYDVCFWHIVCDVGFVLALYVLMRLVFRDVASFIPKIPLQFYGILLLFLFVMLVLEEIIILVLKIYFRESTSNTNTHKHKSKDKRK